MLVRFVVYNFLSFKDPLLFNLIADTKSQAHPNQIAKCLDESVLKNALIFGPNASGKSNLIKAVDFARSTILQGSIPNALNSHFRINAEQSHEQVGSCQFVIFTGGHFYSYGFVVSYQTKEVISEWLRIVDNPDDAAVVFLRQYSTAQDPAQNQGAAQTSTDNDLPPNISPFTIQMGELGEKCPDSLKSRLEIYCEDFSLHAAQFSHQLFLTEVIRRTPHGLLQEFLPAFLDVFNWFKQLTILQRPAIGYHRIALSAPFASKDIYKFASYLNYFGTGITGIELEKSKFDVLLKAIPNPSLAKEIIEKVLKLDHSQGCLLQFESSLFLLCFENDKPVAHVVKLIHGDTAHSFSLEDESQGVLHLLNLIPLIFALNSGHVVLIDDLDRSLHPYVAREFLNLFTSKNEQNNGQDSKQELSQLIATTHDISMMDLHLMRRDAIFLMELQENHASKIYSSAQFKSLFDNNPSNSYLAGRYGALPKFNNEALLGIANDQKEAKAN